MVNVIGQKCQGEFGLFCKSLRGDIVPDPPGRKLSQPDPSPPDHPFEACIGHPEGDAKLVG